MSSEQNLKNVSADPQLTVDDLLHAITNSQPQLRYRPGAQSKFLYILNSLPTYVTDAMVRFQFRNDPVPAFAKQTVKAKGQ